MSGIDEQPCDISHCPKCNYDILTWPFRGNKGYGHYNIDRPVGGYLSNTVFLKEGMDFPDIDNIHCYGCNHKYYEGSLLFKSVISEAKKAIITRNR